jgi:hypothetical protein
MDQLYKRHDYSTKCTPWQTMHGRPAGRTINCTCTAYGVVHSSSSSSVDSSSSVAVSLTVSLMAVMAAHRTATAAESKHNRTPYDNVHPVNRLLCAALLVAKPERNNAHLCHQSCMWAGKLVSVYRASWGNMLSSALARSLCGSVN